MHYIKLYGSIKSGSLAAEGGFALALWPLFMSEADWDGVVNAHPGVLAAKWSGRGNYGKFTEDQVRAAIAYWESPDPSSRTPTDEGRRIRRLSESRDWGWKIVNWEQYRDDEDQSRKRTLGANRQRNYRARLAGSSSDNLFPDDSNAGNAQSVTSDAGDAKSDDTEDRGQRTKEQEVGKARPVPCPHEKIIDLYHEILPALPRIVEWTQTRRGYLSARWNSSPKRQHLEYWRRFFEFVKASDFLMGQVPSRDPNRAPFKADLEWLIKPSNFAKILEHKYHHE